MARVICHRRRAITMLNSSANDTMGRLIYNDGLNPKEIKKDLIGPVDPVSNLRPVVFRIPENESDLEKKLRLQREEVQKWNQDFWAKHNSNFIKQKQDFMKTLSSDGDMKVTEKKALTSQEMSVFYKNFLDNNWETHLTYNKEWYKRNFKLLFLSYRVKCDNFIRKLIPY